MWLICGEKASIFAFQQVKATWCENYCIGALCKNFVMEANLALLAPNPCSFTSGAPSNNKN
jgi:hypothetical protein